MQPSPAPTAITAVAVREGNTLSIRCASKAGGASARALSTSAAINAGSMR